MPVPTAENVRREQKKGAGEGTSESECSASNTPSRGTSAQRCPVSTEHLGMKPGQRSGLWICLIIISMLAVFEVMGTVRSRVESVWDVDSKGQGQTLEVQQCLRSRSHKSRSHRNS